MSPIRASGGDERNITNHPDPTDRAANWSPDGRSILFASGRGEDWGGRLYTVGVDGGMPASALDALGSRRLAGREHQGHEREAPGARQNVEEIEEPLMQKVRYLDKLVDELAKGRPMQKVLRSPA